MRSDLLTNSTPPQPTETPAKKINPSPILSPATFRSQSALFSLAANLRFWLIAAVGLACDLASKSWALRVIGNPDGENGYADLQPIVLIEDTLRFITVLNPGASWGMAAGKTNLLLIGSAVALIFMFWLYVSLKRNQWVSQIALGMLLGGALGNTYDRLFNDGKVVDFIDVDLGFWPANPWPAFNVADSLLCVGVAILLLSMLFRKKATSNQ